MKKMWKRRFRDRGPKYMNVVKRRQYYLYFCQQKFSRRKRRRDVPDFEQTQHGKNRIVERA
jgi:hypothetical protein